ncbi:hypothetical protein PA598K_06077 [Paenibacillus sp. 598K]|uniref:hypothetical protein n=1 Tax=Paenibacillus sp. 598K TaxID=1117987 RepID=UPI000FF9444E|nr:hypothetical protein [Paenibacillus sp. 598K]GBF77523.1 hypothetical protein PA598K_06077 [Paenibacillus sp. 598K]
MKVGTSYFGNKAVPYVAQDMAYLQQEGFTDVLFTFNEEDTIFYMQAMKEMVAAAHRQGLQVSVSPWSVANIFGGQALSKFVAYHPEECQVGSDGKTYPAACLNSPKLLELMHGWLDSAAEIGADLVFWDEPHWLLYETGLFDMEPDTWGCRCERCQQLFESTMGYPMPLEETTDVIRFKHDGSVRLVGELSRYAHALGMRVAVCLLPILKTPEDWQHWHDIASCPDVDIFATDPYSVMGETGLDDHYLKGTYDYVRYYSEKVLELCEQYGKEGQIWIQNFRIPSGQEPEVAIAVEAASQAGIRNLFAWGFRGSEYMSFLRCENSEAAWSAYKQAVQKARLQAVGGE